MRVLLLTHSSNDREAPVRVLHDLAARSDVMLSTCDSLDAVSDGQADVFVLHSASVTPVLLERLNALHQRAPHLPILVVLADGDIQQGTEFLHHGAQDVLFAREITPHMLRQRLVFAVERAAHAAQIEQQLQIYRAIVDDQVDLVFRYDTNFRLTFVNRAYSQQFASTPDAMIGDQFLNRIPAADRAHARWKITQLNAEHPVTTSEHRSIMPDGSVRWFQWTDRAILDDSGAVIEYQGVGRDITEYRAAQEEIRRTREQYRSLLESSDAAIGMLDLEGRILFVNRRAADMLDQSIDQVQGKLVSDFVCERITGDLLRDIQQVFAHGGGIVSETSVTLGDDVRWLRISVQPIRDAYGVIFAVLVNSVDITERKHHEVAIERSEMRLRALLAVDEAILTGKSVREMASNALDHIYGLVPFRRAFICMFNESDDGMLRIAARGSEGLPLMPDDFFSLPMPIRRLIANQPYLLVRDLHEYAETTLTNAIKDGLNAMLSVGLKREGRLIGVLSLFAATPDFFTAEYIQLAVEMAHQLAIAIYTHQLDTRLHQYATELEQRVIERTAELAREKNRIEAMFESSSDAMLLVDLTTGVQHANTAFRELYGADMISVGTSLGNLAHQDDLLVMAEALMKTVETQGINRVEIRARRADGTIFYAEIGMAYIKQSPQESPSIICSIRDVTQRRESEQALERALAQEKELSDLKTHFVSTASHEFRTPLTAILATADTLSLYRQRMDDSQIEMRLQKIRQQVGYMKSLMDDILQLSRIESRGMDFHPTEAVLDDLIRDIIEDFESNPDCAGRVRFSRAQTTPVTGQIDSQMIRHIISNLISNGLKYSQSPSPVDVDLRTDAGYAVITVRDYGIGIPSSDLKHLFQPFFRATNVREIPGTGLGLTIAHEAVKAHGGSITVQSDMETGTTFVVKIPLRA